MLIPSFSKQRGVNMYNFSKKLSPKEIAIIFATFLKCPDYDNCENCLLNNCRLDGHRIGCFKLRDLAMRKTIEMFEDRGK